MIGQITQFAGATAPTNHAFCDGALLSVASHADLFAVIGTAYGGDGVTDFALPDFRGRGPVAPDEVIGLASKGGAAEVALSVAQLPEHSHHIGAYTDDGETDEPAGAVQAKAAGGESIYTSEASDAFMQPTANTGSGAPVPTQSPFLAVNFIIQTR